MTDIWPDFPERYRLSKMQNLLMVFLARGLTNEEIARNMDLSQDTVKVNLSRMIHRFDAKDRSGLQKFALKTLLGGAECIVPELPQQTPPLNAQFLLDLFLPESRCEEFLGDLQERYGRKLPRLGKVRADWWYRKQVATSLWPLFGAFLRRASKGSLAHVLCFALRLLGQASWADALKEKVEEESRRST